MSPLAFLQNDPQTTNPQYLEDLATAYWFSEALFTAVELDVFTAMEPNGKSLAELTKLLKLNQGALKRFLKALCSLGLLFEFQETYFNTKISRQYLVKTSQDYQGEAILWRKYLTENWRSLQGCLQAGRRVVFAQNDEDPQELIDRIRKYSRAMSAAAQTKVQEMLPFFARINLSGKILDVGSGVGTVAKGFLDRFPQTEATLLDLQQVLDYGRELAGEKYGARLNFYPANILEDWPVEDNSFDLVILSNIIHAYSEEEIPELLHKAAKCLKSNGILLIHDFFDEHNPAKAALFDLNMLTNTYNGRVFPASWVKEELAKLKLYQTELLSPASDTALIVAAKEENILENLCLDKKTQLAAKIKTLGFQQALPIPIEAIHIPNWTALRCQFGCSSYGKPHCPPNSPTAEKTRQVLADYTQCLLLQGAPPTNEFQKLVLQAEKTAFKAGYHKALAYWAGPCSICNQCAADGICHNTKNARPSMESSGIDVFTTVRNAGLSLKTLADQDDFIKYYAILLLE
ncbi:DUF2284 domain-containing protein [Bacillota bacterium LX-D]|nr:DUF2284 domain-containing protein [Bacillota bacterium LX-D]